MVGKEKMKLTPVIEAEFEQVMELYHQAIGEMGCTWDEEYPSKEHIQGDIEANALYAFRDDKGRIIAAIARDRDCVVDQLPCWNPQWKPAAELARLVVSKEYQNQGMARKLLAGAMEELKKQGFRSVHYLVSPGNTRALRSYAAMEFQRVGETTLYGEKWFCYEKELRD